jgi:hypothetical protein
MTNFRTDVRISVSEHQISLKTPVLTAGSCFAEVIGSQLENFKFPVMSNPFGIIYNPLSIHKSLLKAIANEPPEDHSYLQSENIWRNYDFHSSLASPSKEELQSQLLNALGAAHYFLKKAKWILITYGTAWSYVRKDTGEVVANCQKVASSNFDKELLSSLQIVTSFDQLHQMITRFNPDARVILTVSPVRHLRDTIELNSVSKAVLRVACHEIVDRYKGVEYFPSYEIMMDDLRDYRFYKRDMIHPNDVAEDYIWARFVERFMNEATKHFINEWHSIKQALDHKAFHPASAAHQRFLQSTLRRLTEISSLIDVEHEMNLVKSRMQ